MNPDRRFVLINRAVRAVSPLVVMVLAASSARAQVLKDEAWKLEGGKGGYCIYYLADPELARKLVPSSTSLVPAGSGTDLPPDLAGYIKDEPKFAQWIPGSICLGFYDRVSSGSHTIAEAKGGRPIIIATHALAAQGAYGVPGTNQYLLEFMTNERRVLNAAEDMGVDMSSIELTKRSIIEGADSTVTITLSDAAIIWTGHPVSEASVGKTRSMSFGYGGPKNSGWLVTWETTPESSRATLGVLWVEGKNKVANVLKSSPGRPIGPQDNGGSATITFHIVTHK